MLGCPRLSPNGKPHGMEFVDEEGFCKAPQIDPQFPAIKYCWYLIINKKHKIIANRSKGVCLICKVKPSTKKGVCNQCRRERQKEYYRVYKERKRNDYKPPPEVLNHITNEELKKIKDLRVLNFSTITDRAGLVYQTFANGSNKSNSYLQSLDLEIKKICSELLTILERECVG